MAGPPAYQALRLEQQQLREDVDWLIDCLGQAKSLCEISWRCHRAKFRAARLRGGSGAGLSLPDVLALEPLHLVRRLCGGREEMLALREASRSSSARAERAFAGSDVYVWGGLDAVGGNALKGGFRLGAREREWEALPQNDASTTCGAGALLGRCFYVCGGHGRDLQSARRFRLASRRWEELAPLRHRRCDPAAAAAGGRLYVCGGEHVGKRVQDSVEVFEPAASSAEAPDVAGAWSVLPAAMLSPRRCFGAAAMSGAGRQEILLCGGSPTPTRREHAGTQVLRSAEALELSGQGPRCRPLPDMPGPRGGLAVASLRGRVYACGGDCGNGLGLSTVDCFDPVSESWSSSPPMLLRRGDFSAVVAGGCLYVLGGVRSCSPGTPAERGAERFDPETGAWERLPWELPRGQTIFLAGAVWNGALAE